MTGKGENRRRRRISQSDGSISITNGLELVSVPEALESVPGNSIDGDRALDTPSPSPLTTSCIRRLIFFPRAPWLDVSSEDRDPEESQKVDDIRSATQ